MERPGGDGEAAATTTAAAATARPLGAGVPSVPGFAFGCTACRAVFADGDAQRAHYKTDWHRYNLKRKMVGMASVTAEEFAVRIPLPLQRHQQQQRWPQPMNEMTIPSDAPATAEAVFHCDACGRAFSSEGARANHLQSRRHRAASAAVQRHVDAVDETHEQRPAECDDQAARADDGADAVGPPPDACLFCPLQCDSMDHVLQHMARQHSFFLPDIEYCVDLAGMLSYLGEKVALGYMCLYCEDTGRTFWSMRAARAHMISKGHCMLRWRPGDELEYADFYDFRPSYPDYVAGANDDEGGDTALLPAGRADCDAARIEDDLSLALPSGTRAVHRSLVSFYRRRLPQPDRRESVTIQRVAAEYRMLGYAGPTVRTREERASRDAAIRRAQQVQLRVSLQTNSLMRARYFRTQNPI